MHEDHGRLGRELDLFDTDPLIGAGLPYWLPDGATVRHELEEYIRDVERRAGYRHVYSPVLGKRELYDISGHRTNYGQDMFPPMDLGGDQVVLRPSREVARRGIEQGLRVEVSGPPDGSLGAQVRAGRLAPYQAVIGSREAADDLVALRLCTGRRLDPMPAGEALCRIGALVRARSADLWDR
jgi:threonyl-tRNA synthetase